MSTNQTTDWNALDTDIFRQTVRAFFEQNYPAEMRYPKTRLRWAEIKDWYMTLSKKGWVAPSWPQVYGGMGLSPEKLIVFIEEQERWGVGRAPDMGITMIGPLLIQYGSEEQQQKYLPKIIQGENIWCQGYSEPNAGSDLASLRTDAVEDGDDFIINGQKTWTTLAQDATHIFFWRAPIKPSRNRKASAFCWPTLQRPALPCGRFATSQGMRNFAKSFLKTCAYPRPIWSAA
jgi:alkylation response protein AidB-like acyl-CoA dehydrogenase